MDWYVSLVTEYPILTAMVQFAILGTIGEVISFKMRGAKGYPFTLYQTVMKMLIWSFLAILIKYAFKGFVFFVDGLATHHYLPGVMQNYDRIQLPGFWDKFGFAIGVSFFMNVLFAPQMMFIHRFLDNIVDKKPGNYAGMKVALSSIFWFWIPAHTVTFVLPGSFRILLAAIWGVVLGIIMGVAGTKKSA